MVYSESLVRRIRQQLLGTSRIVEKKMFGSVGFLLNSNMCVGVWKDSLIARVGPDQYAGALEKPFVAEFDVTGRAMRGWVLIEPEGLDTDEQLREWVQLALRFVRTLPAKT